jgi:hypothetical protein
MDQPVCKALKHRIFANDADKFSCQRIRRHRSGRAEPMGIENRLWGRAKRGGHALRFRVSSPSHRNNKRLFAAIIPLSPSRRLTNKTECLYFDHSTVRG